MAMEIPSESAGRSVILVHPPPSKAGVAGAFLLLAVLAIVAIWSTFFVSAEPSSHQPRALLDVLGCWLLLALMLPIVAIYLNPLTRLEVQRGGLALVRHRGGSIQIEWSRLSSLEPIGSGGLVDSKGDWKLTYRIGPHRYKSIHLPRRALLELQESVNYPASAPRTGS